MVAILEVLFSNAVHVIAGIIVLGCIYIVITTNTLPPPLDTLFTVIISFYFGNVSKSFVRKDLT